LHGHEYQPGRPVRRPHPASNAGPDLAGRGSLALAVAVNTTMFGVVLDFASGATLRFELPLSF
jgi:hypothetical protein